MTYRRSQPKQARKTAFPTPQRISPRPFHSVASGAAPPTSLAPEVGYSTSLLKLSLTLSAADTRLVRCSFKKAGVRSQAAHFQCTLCIRPSLYLQGKCAFVGYGTWCSSAGAEASTVTLL